MKRILILGCCGAGKSTLARKLTDILKLPIIHLDQQYWKAGWQEPSKSEWNQKVSELIQEDRWIMDGNYGGTLDMRLKRADTVIFLNRTTWTCMSRVLKRIKRYKGKSRPDMPAGCPERYDWNFLHYVLIFNWTRAPKIKQKLKAFENQKEIFILNSEQKIANFLNTLAK